VSEVVRDVLTGPGRGINKIGDTLGIGRGNFVRKFSASSQLAQNLYDDNGALTARGILNPSGNGNVLDPVGGSSQFKSETPGAPPAPPAPASIDTARQQLQENDRLRRRRGVIANIFGGSSAGAPTVAVKTLLGS
jgi:hypothetical protein